MNPIDLPFKQRNFKLKAMDDKMHIWDALRKKYIKLTPEEEVRQHIIAILIDDLLYPAAKIALEKQVKVGKLTKRFDIVVYDPQHQPWILIECKAPSVAISEQTLMQALSYIQTLQTPYCLLSNGRFSFIATLDLATGSYTWLEKMPIYPSH